MVTLSCGLERFSQTPDRELGAARRVDMREQLITVDGHMALVMELGRHTDVRQWWMRERSGVAGLEAIDDNGHMVRLEMREPEAFSGDAE